jgi:hypothetical protein
VHLLVRSLREIAIPLSYGAEMLRRASTNNLVGGPGKFPAAVRRTHWNGDDDARRTLCPDGLNCSFHCRAGRQAIVDQQDDAITELDRRPATPIRALSTGELDLLLTRNVIDDGSRDLVLAHNILVENPHTTGCDRAHREFTLAGQPELSDQEDIQGGVERASNFVRDRYTSAWQCDDHDRASTVKVSEVCRQFNAGLPAVLVRLLVTEFCGHEFVLARLMMQAGYIRISRRSGIAFAKNRSLEQSFEQQT